MRKPLFYFILAILSTAFCLTQTLVAKSDAKSSADAMTMPQGTTYHNDPTHSSATFSANHLIFTKVPGKFKKIEATVTLDNGKITMLEAMAQVKSIDTGNKKRDKHLRNKSFFAAKKFPKIMLKMISHTKNTLKAELTIRGVKKVVNFDFSHGYVEANKRRANRRLGVVLSTKIHRKDFNVGKKYNDKVISDKISVELSFGFDLIKPKK